VHACERGISPSPSSTPPSLKVSVCVYASQGECVCMHVACVALRCRQVPLAGRDRERGRSLGVKKRGGSAGA